MIFSLDIRRALEGDCLIVHYGTKDKPRLVLIDGGPNQVYKPQLKPRLAQIRNARGLADDESLPVDLMMVSHIDDDHINGILDLTKELVNAQDSRKPLPLKIRRFWHNTFDDILGNDAEELRAAVTSSFGAAALTGEPDTEGLDPDAAMVLASVGQGLRLRDDVRKLNLRINPEFDGKLVMAVQGGTKKDMDKSLSLTVAGPMEAELTALQTEYAHFLEEKEKKKTEKEAKKALASFTDDSAPNLSSIVLLAEVDGKRMLLTGDARGDKILEGLELVELLKKDGNMHVDILKMPHHGSDRNIEPIFFRRITADHYVFSGNGKYGNPERETLQMLLDVRGDKQYTIHLTYPVEDIDVKRKETWDTEQQNEKKRQQKNSKLRVREDWSPKKHSLTSFFAEHEDFAKKLSIVEAEKPHIINLLEEVGF